MQPLDIDVEAYQSTTNGDERRTLNGCRADRADKRQFSKTLPWLGSWEVLKTADYPPCLPCFLISDVRLLVIDPVVSAVAGDSHKNTEVRRSLQPIVDLDAQTNCAALGISRFSKGTSGHAP